MNTSEKITRAFQSIMRSQSITYNQLAEYLHMSEAGIKKMFKSNAYSIERIEAICRVLNISILDIFQLVSSQNLTPTKFTIEQEQFLIGEEKCLCILYLMIQRWSLTEIQRTYKLKSNELERILLKLDKMGFIQFHSSNKAKVMVGSQIKWIKNGPIEKYFKESIKSDFLDDDFKKEGEALHLISGEFSITSVKLITRKLDDLANLVRELSNNDRLLPKEQSESIGMIMGIRHWKALIFRNL